jgi:putative membrane protein
VGARETKRGRLLYTPAGPQPFAIGPAVPYRRWAKSNAGADLPAPGGTMEPTPRDYLANERTFLAYVRTALSFIAFGFVVARFALFAHEMAAVEHLGSTPTYVSNSLGIGMTVVGIAVALFGAARYAQQDRALRNASSEGTLSKRAALTVALVVVVFGAIIAADLLRIR